jgi:hypothetical protein
MKRRWLQNSLLMLFGVGLALVIVLYLRPYLLPEKAAPIVETSCQPAPSELLATFKQVVADSRDPCAEFYWRPEPSAEFHVLVRLNNFGLHAPIYSLEKPDHVFRLLLIGDSFPQGMQVNLEETFPYLLQQELGQIDGKQVEVINLSIDAFGTDRELLLYAYLGWQFQPDMVLLALYPGNDIQDNQIDLEARRYGYRLNRPFFTLDGKILRLHNSVELDAALYPDSATFRWLADLQAGQSPPPDENLPERPQVSSTEPYTLEYPVELGIYLLQDVYWESAWALTESLLLQFREVVALDDMPFATVIIPDRRAVHDADWAALLAEYGNLLPELNSADPTAPGSRLEGFLGDQTIPTLNLTATLHDWAAAHPDGRLYYPGDGHFTLDGHSITAEALAAWLRDNGLLNAS